MALAVTLVGGAGAFGLAAPAAGGAAEPILIMAPPDNSK